MFAHKDICLLTAACDLLLLHYLHLYNCFRNRAKDAHRKKQWAEVQQWCTRVIDIADDWNAIEQAHLRLALAEQKRAGADGGRRAFQVCVCVCGGPFNNTNYYYIVIHEKKKVRIEPTPSIDLKQRIFIFV